MMKEVVYLGIRDRERQVARQEALGLRMVNDTFYPGSIGGTMVWTDEPAAPPQVARDFGAEIDALAVRVAALGG